MLNSSTFTRYRIQKRTFINLSSKSSIQNYASFLQMNIGPLSKQIKIKRISFIKLAVVKPGMCFEILPSERVFWVAELSSSETEDEETKLFAWTSKNASKESPYCTLMYPSLSNIFMFIIAANIGRASVGDRKDIRPAVSSNICPPDLLKVAQVSPLLLPVFMLSEVFEQNGIVFFGSVRKYFFWSVLSIFVVISVSVSVSVRVYCLF